MKANELRIGSTYLSVKFNLPVILQAGDFYNLIIRAEGADISHYIDEYIQPIPLTEEWLIKFGFVYNLYDETWDKKISKNSVIDFRLLDDFTLCDIDLTVDLNYVHQLQNLYFALTGKELKIK